MPFETNTITPKQYYARLSGELIESSRISVEESQRVHSWHDVLCRVLDAGDDTTYDNIAYAITGRAQLIVPDHIPSNIEDLPRVDGVATDYSLSQMLKQEVEVCPIIEPGSVSVQLRSEVR